MADDNSSEKSTTGERKEKTVKTDTMTVDGHLLKWDDVAIQISNISDITVTDVFSTETKIVQPEKSDSSGFIVGIMMLVLGLITVVISLAIGNDVWNDSYIFSLLGVVFVFIGAIIAFLDLNKKPAEKTIQVKRSH